MDDSVIISLTLEEERVQLDENCMNVVHNRFKKFVERIIIKAGMRSSNMSFVTVYHYRTSSLQRVFRYANAIKIR